jgi:hypothetical protein
MGGDLVTTVTSRLPALITYLVTLFTADPTLGTATPPVTVYDGPPVTLLDAPLKLYVGWTDPDNPDGEPAGESVQSWGALGRLGRDETVTIHCCAEAWSGTDVVATVRTACTGITSAVEVLMQSDATQFGGNVLFPDPGLTNVSVPQNQTAQGALVRQTFDLVFRCRIGGF